MYERLEQIDNGDINWIIPGKVAAFSCPADTSEVINGFRPLTVEQFVDLFKELGISTVIRLNKVTYNGERFRVRGIAHHDVYFPDGSSPSEEIVKQIIEIIEASSGAVGIHCKAGLGRTGTVIGCYAMKHYGFRAQEYIAWNRICRPGSILGG
jgi:cell division cycle 14